MKFNSQICTTKEQSERLLALGLKKETADMLYMQINGYWVCIISQGDEEYIPYEDHLPAWSLHRLIVLSGMGIIETTTDNIYDKVIQYIEFLIKCEDFNKEYLEE